MPLLASIAAACLAPLAIFTLVIGLDDLVPVLLMVCGWLRRKLNPCDELATPPEIPEKRIAVFVPLWREHEVIGRMVEHNVGAIRYRNYDIFLGTYPNDTATQEAVRDLERRFPNVHLCTCPNDGPTSKGDCLNTIHEAMLLRERRTNVRFDAIVTHDAEDLINPDALHWINFHLDRYDMVQLPVLPLPTPIRMLTHGIYCDEFAEYQTKDIPARQASRSFLPSNGVGTGYSREAIDALGRSGSKRVFEPGCLTEDYENGLRIHLLGLRQFFLPIRFAAGRPVATREYFPRQVRQAVKQRTRWIIGITLQSWERYGWRGTLPVVYWFWRDRKGLLGNPVSVFGNMVFLYGAATLLWSHLTGSVWELEAATHSPFLAPALAVTLAQQALHLAIRIGCVARIYGWGFAAGAPLRMLWANGINSLSTILAIGRFLAARMRRHSLQWTKTEHDYPARQALAPHKRKLGEILVGCRRLTVADLDTALDSKPPGVRLGEHLMQLGKLTEPQVYEALALQQGLATQPVEPSQVRLEVARALPLDVVVRCKIVPFRVENGRLFVAGPELPSEAAERLLRRHTRLDTRFHLITPDNFEQLKHQLL